MTRLPKSVLRSRLWKLAVCLPADAWQGGKNKTNQRNFLEPTDQPSGLWVQSLSQSSSGGEPEQGEHPRPSLQHQVWREVAMR